MANENKNVNNTENTEVKEKFNAKNFVKKGWGAVKKYGPHWLGSMVLTLTGVLAFGAISEHTAIKEAPKPVTFDVGNGVEITQF